MIKEFVPYQESLELKELGFDESCFGDYFKFEDGQIILDTDDDRDRIVTDNPDEEIEQILAPTFSQAFRWFREKCYDVSFRKMDYGVDSNFTGYYYTIYNGNNTIDLHGADKKSKTYEEAELACLRKLIQIAKEKL